MTTNLAENKQGSEQQAILDVARKFLNKADGDVRRAVILMERSVRKNQKLREQLTDSLINNACFDAIRRICQIERRHIWLAPNYDAGGAGERITYLADGNLELLKMRLPISGMPVLADSDHEQIEQAINWYDRHAKDMQHKAKWLTLIFESLPEGSLVGGSFTEDQLRQMQEDAK